MRIMMWDRTEVNHDDSLLLSTYTEESLLRCTNSIYKTVPQDESADTW